MRGQSWPEEYYAELETEAAEMKYQADEHAWLREWHETARKFMESRGLWQEYLLTAGEVTEKERALLIFSRIGWTLICIGIGLMAGYAWALWSLKI